MPCMIPEKTFGLIERKLYSRYRLIDDATANLRCAQQDAHTIRSPTASRDGGHTQGAISDKTAGYALDVIAAEAKLCAAVKWCEVFSTIDDIFANQPESQLAALIYVQSMSAKDAAAEIGVDRRTAYAMRDRYVVHCALLAAEKGLIRLTKEGRSG